MREFLALNLPYFVAAITACLIFTAIGFAGVSYLVAIVLFMVSYLLGVHTGRTEAKLERERTK